MGSGEEESTEPAAEKEDDAFASLRLDEEFVKAATRSEPPAEHRAPPRPVSSRPARPARFDRQMAWIQAHHWVVYGAVIVVALIAVAAIRHLGPLASTATSPSASSGLPPVHSTTASLPSSSSSTTTSPVNLVQRSYKTGDCVKWDPTDPAEDVSTSVVPCSEPHLIEMVSKATVPASVSSYPDAAKWVDLATILCAKPVTSYLGYALDPAGRFQVSDIGPTPESWAQGDRTFWCGLDLGSTKGIPNLLFTGAVRGQSQEYLYPIGACLSVSAQGITNADAVPCTQPHTYEVVGNASLASLPQLPQGSTALADAVRAQCATVASQYAGGALPAGVDWGYLGLAQASWNAGDRMVQCTIERVGSSGPTSSTGSLKG